MSSKALDRLIGRTLKSDGVKKETRGQRKAKKKHAAAVKAAKEAEKADTEAIRAARRREENLKHLEAAEETEDLKTEILKVIDKKTVWVKRTRKKHEYSFPGLTPGLAPVDYNPDESDEDEPY